jgi:hypothetical protein
MPNTIKLRQLPTFQIEVDGQLANGTFTVESEWEGFVKLVCSSGGPLSHVIIRKPHIGHGQNIHDLIPKLFGGNRDTNLPLVIDCEQIGGSNLRPKSP